ncbi:hypothetical protein DTO57_04210 [Microbacterium sorbitolivorans]|uniref:Uncharacterized protein n=1 Tax=Microbacterium sorbitolivorans TaxID=1867410 RepID=A0A367Y7M0_9MICO|nr:hypothetical protein DTO57_04210 [Microbacterium sorbitolivorans]
MAGLTTAKQRDGGACGKIPAVDNGYDVPLVVLRTDAYTDNGKHLLSWRETVTCELEVRHGAPVRRSLPCTSRGLCRQALAALDDLGENLAVDFIQRYPYCARAVHRHRIQQFVDSWTTPGRAAIRRHHDLAIEHGDDPTSRLDSDNAARQGDRK